MPGYGIFKVVGTKAESHPTGTLVIGWCGWTEYGIADAKDCQIIQQIPGLSITQYLGSLGGTGLTAYYGLVSFFSESRAWTLESNPRYLGVDHLHTSNTNSWTD